MIHKVATSLLLTLLSLTATAQDAPAPLIIVTPTRGDAQLGGAALGVIGGTNWDELAASDFSGIGVPPEDADSRYIWLADGSRSSDYGWLLICLNQYAALHNANAPGRAI